MKAPSCKSLESPADFSWKMRAQQSKRDPALMNLDVFLFAFFLADPSEITRTVNNVSFKGELIIMCVRGLSERLKALWLQGLCEF